MHYFQFNIGDYKSHTWMLKPLEDIAYRRCLDYIYLNEKPLDNDIEEIARDIDLSDHIEQIKYVLKKYFIETDEGYINKRAFIEIDAFHDKKEKAKSSAKKRWDKSKLHTQTERNANVMRTHSEGNAKQETRTIKQETKNKNQDIIKPQNEFADMCEKEFLKIWESELKVSIPNRNRRGPSLKQYKKARKHLTGNEIVAAWRFYKSGFEDDNAGGFCYEKNSNWEYLKDMFEESRKTKLTQFKSKEELQKDDDAALKKYRQKQEGEK